MEEDGGDTVGEAAFAGCETTIAAEWRRRRRRGRSRREAAGGGLIVTV